MWPDPVQPMGSTSQEDEDAFLKAQIFATNLSKLRNIREFDIPVQVVPIEATLTDAIDVFDRVNSLGTHLTEAELALTHVTGNWPLARRTLKSKTDLLKQEGFEFDLTFMTRALVTTITDHALFEHIHSVPRGALESGWERLSRIVDYVASILPSRAFIDSTRDMSSKNPLIPIIRFLSLNEGRFQSDKSLRRGIHWFYMAQIHQRYAGQTDSRLEHDVTIVNRENPPWQSLLNQIVDQRGRIKVLPDDLEGRGVSHPLYAMSLILAKSCGAVDWFNGLSLAAGVGNIYGIHGHHIFPQSVLYKNGFSSDSHLDRQTVNSIANRAFLTAETDMSIKNRLPEEYLPEVEERFPRALERQFIPLEPHLWKLERFHEFLDARRALIADRLNDFLEGLTREDEQVGIRPLSDLIAMGEGVNLEFKSTLQWDVVRGEQNRGLRDSVLKTLVAFMNSEGGTLLIGVEDGGQVFGLEQDLSLVRGSHDGFLQLLNSIVADRIGIQYSPYVHTNIESIDGNTICVVNISRSTDPAFLSGQRGREFYARIGNTTRALDPEQTIAYLEHSSR